MAKSGIWRSLRKKLNFYRIHILTFIFVPLILSAILYASNAEFPISYIDSLFLSVSAMTVCGLATVDLSKLTAWQQVILFILMSLGSPVVVSWVMVYIRRYYFAKKFEHILAANKARRSTESALLNSGGVKIPLKLHIRALLCHSRAPKSPRLDEKYLVDGKESPQPKRFRTDMIRRMDDAPKLVDPSGWISEGRASVRLGRTDTIQSIYPESHRQLSFAEPPSSEPKLIKSPPLLPIAETPRPFPRRRLSDPGSSSRPSSLRNNPFPRFETMAVESRSRSNRMSRTQTVEFAREVTRGRNSILKPPVDAKSVYSRGSIQPQPSLSTYNAPPTHKKTKYSGFGGFPMPHEIIRSLFHKFFPNLQRRLTRTITVPRTTTIASTYGGTIPVGAKAVPYISFDAVVGRNSQFPLLNKEQLEELGGVEYRALNALLWIVAVYHIGIQLVGFIIIAPYMSMNKWENDFLPPNLHRPVIPTWFSLFQVVSAYTNSGMSLVDTSMVPFQKAYPMILIMVYQILAGNTCFPIFLRLMIWILSKMVPHGSRTSETLHFLLDHPRRCFIYLFPSHQTWFLLTIVLMLNATDWFFFMVLDIGNPAIESIPLGVRFLNGLLQAIAVRAAGFGIVALSALAPAVKVLYVVMMYISVYPIAMSVRSTNVYEEQSLGVFQDHESDIEKHFDAEGSRVTVWSRYLAMHARKQLSFDMWWLGLALFFVCIIERHNLDNDSQATWFNIFSIIFELTSAYGTVGLSLGIPNANYSFSGAFSTLSKLIVIVVMIRGRHRGLPVAIDRAVMLPVEFDRENVYHAPVSATATNPPTGDQASYNSDSSELRHRLARQRSLGEMGIDEARRLARSQDISG